MLTSGDIQFEPSQTKVWELTPHLAVMIAGDAAIQSEILSRVYFDVHSQSQANPDLLVSVREVARLYRHYFREALLDRAEDAILAPLGLDRETFISRQRDLNSDLAAQIAHNLTSYHFNDALEAIILGIDSDGPQRQTGTSWYPHLYTTYNSEVTCQDAIGFATIGIGRSHAQSQFMFGGYERRWKFSRAMLLTHSAKKRAEVSPGVGKATDMFAIGPRDAPFFPIGNHAIVELEKNYAEMQKGVDRASARSEKRMAAFDKAMDAKAAIAKALPKA